MGAAGTIERAWHHRWVCRRRTHFIADLHAVLQSTQAASLLLYSGVEVCDIATGWEGKCWNPTRLSFPEAWQRRLMCTPLVLNPPSIITSISTAWSAMENAFSLIFSVQTRHGLQGQCDMRMQSICSVAAECVTATTVNQAHNPYMMERDESEIKRDVTRVWLSTWLSMCAFRTP